MELKRRHDELAASIDAQLDEALKLVDRKRRAEAEKDIAAWVRTYCVPLMLNDPPPKLGESLLQAMYEAVTSHSNFLCCVPRGHGKTSYAECVALYAVATGRQKYVVIISNNLRAANGIMMDIWHAVAEEDTPFARDYPEICLPFQICKGSFRRKQTYRGISTEIQKNSSNLVFARLVGEGGEEFATSGSIITCRGVSSGLRGMKFKNLRPTCAILDDLQSSETAENPASVEKLMATIKKDIIPLAGKQRLSILQTATPICCDDLVDRLKADLSWKTLVYKAVLKFPANEDLWREYFKIYDTESMQGLGHGRSLDFYRNNFKAMNEGAEVFNESRYSEEDGHISAIQKLMELRHAIGEDAFLAEYQMTPRKFTFAVDVSPRDVSQRIGGFPKAVVPAGYGFVCAATDLNVSHALTTTVTAFRPDNGAVVLTYRIFKANVDMKLNDTEYNRRVYELLEKAGKWLKALNLGISAWGIDAGGRNWDTVCEFAKNSAALCGIPACAMAGKASHVFNPNVRSRLRDSLNRTVLCGDAQEHARGGAGQKYMFFDSDFYREKFQKAILSPLGSIGSCQLYLGTVDEHQEFAAQTTNERLKMIRKMPDGRLMYFWTSKEPHDYLDAMAMCYAIAGSQGISGQAAAAPDQAKRLALRRIAAMRGSKPRIRFV